MVEYELRPTFEAKFDGMDRKEFEIVEIESADNDLETMESSIGYVIIKGSNKAWVQFYSFGNYEIFSNGIIVKERERATVKTINPGASIETVTHTKEMYESITYFDNSPDELDCIYYDILDLLGG